MPQHNPSENEINFIQTLQIHDVVLLENNHKVTKLYNPKEHSNLSVLLEKDDDNTNIYVDNNLVIFEYAMNLKIENAVDLNSELLVESFAKYAAIYSYKNLTEYNEKEIEIFAHNFFRFSAITHIMSYLRTHFYHLIISSGFPRLHIALVKSALDQEAEQVASEHLVSIKE